MKDTSKSANRLGPSQAAPEMKRPGEAHAASGSKEPSPCVLWLRGKEIDGDTFSCTGPQIALVLEMLRALPDLADCAWYAGALDAYAPPLAPYHTAEARRIPDFDRFLDMVRATGQLLDGVILAVRGPERPEVLADGITADGPTEKLVPSAAVEVCAHDTAWIEVHAERADWIEPLRARFGGELASARD